jgi:hypothetical protein
MGNLVQRYQNPAVNDTVRLRLLTFNSNLPQNLQTINTVSIYFFDPYSKTPDNPDGALLVQTVPGTSVVNDAPGSYYLDLPLPGPQYVIGKYKDVWNVVFEPNAPAVDVTKYFEIYPSLWYTSDIPIVYDFNFCFQPARIVQGSKKWLIIEIIPNVPRASDLYSYYTNLAISSNLYITIAKKCDPCLPQEQDLRIIIDQAPVEQREKVFGYYWLDTSEMDGGLHDVWFTLNFGGNTYVSERQQLLIWC